MENDHLLEVTSVMMLKALAQVAFDFKWFFYFNADCHWKPTAAACLKALKKESLFIQFHNWWVSTKVHN